MNISIEIIPSVNPLTGATGEVVGRTGMITPPLASDDESCTVSLKQSIAVKPPNLVAEKMDEKKKRRKKKWKKPKDKPSRPLSAYNLFFQFERSNMLGDDAPTQELENLKKRVHCKTHGKIGFAEMARAIGGRWKALESEKKRPYLERAAAEKKRYAAELAAWKEAQKDKAVDEPNNGLDAMAAAAMASDPIESDQSTTCSQSPEPKPSDSLRMAMAGEVHRRNLCMLQHRPANLDYIRALQDRQLGLSRFDSPLMNYPSAAEASASALLQHFQGFSQVPPPSRPTAQSLPIFEAEQLSKLAASGYPSSLATMRQLQYMSNNRFGL